MSKLASLHQHLCEKLQSHVHSKKIHATQTGGTIDCSSSRYINSEGLVVATWRYNAGIFIENFPHHKLNPSILFALIAVWLSVNAPELTLPDPSIDIEVNNEESADVLIMLQFEEPIELTADVDGLIDVGDQSFTVGKAEVWIAETFELEPELQLELNDQLK